MAKAKQQFVCEVCGDKFSGGRAKGIHVANSPKCQTPEWKEKQAKKAAKGSKSGKLFEQEQTASQLIAAAVKKLETEIADKRALLANVEQIKKDITALETQQTALKKMLPAETPI